MDEPLRISIYVFLLAIIFALMEIQIEGPNGWAANLPTWKSKRQVLGKYLTGYHLTIFTLAFLIFHLPFVFGLPLSFEAELKTLSLFFMFVVLWDFLWFVLNPYFPLKKFKKEFISWHKHWYVFAPVDYFMGLVASLLILLPLILANEPIIGWWLSNLFVFSSGTLILVVLTTLFPSKD